MDIGSEQFKILFHYNPETGMFQRRCKRSTPSGIGRVVGTLNNGILSFMIYGKVYAAHRLAFLYMTGEMPFQKVVHIDGIKTNNRWDNLSDGPVVARRPDCNTRSDNTSGFTGVRPAPMEGFWCASIWLDGKNTYLGTFDTKDEAVAARVIAEQRRESAKKLGRVSGEQRRESARKRDRVSAGHRRTATGSSQEADRRIAAQRRGRARKWARVIADQRWDRRGSGTG